MANIKWCMQEEEEFNCEDDLVKRIVERETKDDS